MLLSTLLLISEVVVLAIGMVLVLILLGLGITVLLLPIAEGYQLLMAPVVGLAFLALSFQWLDPFLPPPVAALVTGLALAPVTVLVGWRRRTLLFGRWRDLAGAGLVALSFFVSLLQIVFRRGFLTMGGFPSDNVFIYVQAAQYLRDHAMPSPLKPLGLHNPGSFYLISTGPAFPNSVGPLDAATSVLAGWPVYALHEPVNAIGLALTIGSVWFFVRAGLGGSWLTALAAGALIATNQLSYWTIGLGFQQESLALPLFVSASAVAAYALRTESLAAGALAGVLGGTLPGLYLPLAAVLSVCVMGCLVVHLAIGPSGHRQRVLRTLGAALISGTVSAGAAVYVLVAEGGLAIWLASVGNRAPAGAISRFPDFPYLAGTVPLAHIWELSPQPLGQLQSAAFPFLYSASALVVILLLMGPIRALRERLAPEAGLLVAGLVFVFYEGAATSGTPASTLPPSPPSGPLLTPVQAAKTSTRSQLECMR